MRIAKEPTFTLRIYLVKHKPARGHHMCAIKHRCLSGRNTRRVAGEEGHTWQTWSEWILQENKTHIRFLPLVTAFTITHQSPKKQLTKLVLFSELSLTTACSANWWDCLLHTVNNDRLEQWSPPPRYEGFQSVDLCCTYPIIADSELIKLLWQSQSSHRHEARTSQWAAEHSCLQVSTVWSVQYHLGSFR